VLHGLVRLSLGFIKDSLFRETLNLPAISFGCPLEFFKRLEIFHVLDVVIIFRVDPKLLSFVNLGTLFRFKLALIFFILLFDFFKFFAIAFLLIRFRFLCRLRFFANLNIRF
jgi:hypothetical protein|tara:strand:+ start:149 stop:484 length:336 start_codon:yes stop_codon:yes gene_type:complete